MADLPIIKKLEAEVEALDREFRITLPRLIREAAAQGDLSDNAEYRAAKQRQEFVKPASRSSSSGSPGWR